MFPFVLLLLWFLLARSRSPSGACAGLQAEVTSRALNPNRFAKWRFALHRLPDSLKFGGSLRFVNVRYPAARPGKGPNVWQTSVD